VIGVEAVIGTVALPILNDPEFVTEYTHVTTFGLVYGQYLKSAKSPVGAATADVAAMLRPRTAKAAAASGRSVFFMLSPP
jgi:hypothetical protein